MPAFEHDGWHLFFEDRGEGQPLLLLHGLFLDHTAFDPLLDPLAGSRLIAPDLRGHGRSEHRSDERTLWEVMEDQVALLDRLEIERAVWVGHSVGGPIALRAALRHPDRVAALVLISTQAGPEHPERFPVYEAFAQTVARDGWTDETLRGLATFNFGTGVAAEVREQWIERWRARPVEDVPAIVRSLTGRESLLGRLGEVRALSLVIYGDQDRLALQPDEVEQMVQGLPQTEFVPIPAAGHTPMLEQPDAVAAAITTFLATARSV